MGLHFSDGEKTNQEMYLEGQNSLKRRTNLQVPMLLFLFSAETNYHSCHLNCPSRLEDLYVNISPALVAMCSLESVQRLQPGKVSNLVWEGTSLGGRGPCCALGWTSAPPGDPDAKELHRRPAGKWLRKNISKMPNSRAGKPQKSCNV